MPTTWIRIYPEGTARLDGMVPGFEDALRYNGLVMTPLYDGETQLVWPGDWELSLEKTDEPLMDIHVSSDELALEIATGIAQRVTGKVSIGSQTGKVRKLAKSCAIS